MADTAAVEALVVTVSSAVAELTAAAVMARATTVAMARAGVARVT